MPDFAFELPLAASGPALIAIAILYSVFGVRWTRRYLLARIGSRAEDSEFIGAIVQAVMVFYGLAVALIAVSVWETHSEVSAVISQEATRLAALYRDVSSYPEPLRSELQDELKGYTYYVINEAWPQHRAGQHPVRGVEWMNRFQASLVGFEPQSTGQQALHAETLRAYNHMLEARRLRLDSMLIRLPGLLWGVIIAGALISLSASFLFHVEDVRLHTLMVTLLAVFIALVILLVLALDRPFHGDLGLDAEPYQLIYDELMLLGSSAAAPG